jgi:hypothetical protein
MNPAATLAELIRQFPDYTVRLAESNVHAKPPHKTSELMEVVCNHTNREIWAWCYHS